MPAFTGMVTGVALLLTGYLVATYFSGAKINDSSWGFFGLGGAARLLHPANFGWAEGATLEAPLLTFILRGANQLGLNEGFLASAISIFAFAASAQLFYRIIGREMDVQAAQRGVILLCLAPFAWMLGLPYHYSVTLMLLLATYYFSQNEKLAYAVLFGVLSVASNVLSLLFLAAIIGMAVESKRPKPKLLAVAGAMLAAGILLPILCKQFWGVSLIQYYKGLDGVRALFSADMQTFFFRSLPVLLYLFGAPVLLYLAKGKIPKHLFLYGLLLIPVPLFVQNCYGDISLLSFPLLMALAYLGKAKSLDRLLVICSAAACGLLMVVQMNYTLY